MAGCTHLNQIDVVTPRGEGCIELEIVKQAETTLEEREEEGALAA